MANPVVHFEVIGDDGANGEKLKQFYAELFDWEVDSDNPVGYGSVAPSTNDAGAGIGGGIMGAPDGYDGHITFYVEVDDVDAAMDRAVELGGQRLMGPDQVPGGPTIGQVTDVTGKMVGLIQKGSY